MINYIFKHFLFCLGSFIDFFGGPIKCFSGQLTSGPPSLFISGCYFAMTTQRTGSGGIIYLSGAYQVVIEETIFYNCRAQYDGGAICFYFSGFGSMAINKVCAFNCYTPGGYSGQFCFSSISPQTNVSIHYLSMASCAPSASTRLNSFYSSRGNYSIKNINSSSNAVQYGSGCTINDPQRLIMKFSNFYNNTASYYYCLYLLNGVFPRLVDYINLERNSSPRNNAEPSGLVFISGSGQVTFSNGILFNNTSTFRLFYISSGSSMIINDVKISHVGESYTGVVVPINVLATYTSTYIFNHFSTQFCSAEFPLIETFAQYSDLNISLKQLISIFYLFLITFISNLM